MYGPYPVLQTGENIAIQHVIADVVHGALAQALPMLDTVIISVWGLVLLVLTVPHCPPAIGTFNQPGENLRGAVLPLPAAAGDILLYPVKIRFADNGLVGVLHLPPFILGLVHPLFALKRHWRLLIVYAVADVRFIQQNFSDLGDCPLVFPALGLALKDVGKGAVPLEVQP